MNLDATSILGWKRRKRQGSLRETARSVTGTPARRSRRASKLSMDVLEDRIALATFRVVDSFDGGPGSLRDAIARANQLGGANRVIITSKVDQPIVLTNGEIKVATGLGIENRSGHPVEIRQATSGSRVFEILAGAASVTITGVDAPITITGGSISGANGGGILVDGPTNLTLTSVVVTGNQVSNGGGGGIYAVGGNTTLITLVGSSVTDNHAPDGSGGGISLEAGRVVVRDDSHVDSNSARDIGGIRVFRGPKHAIDIVFPVPSPRRDAVRVLNGSSVSGNSSTATVNLEKGDLGGGGIAVESTGSVLVSDSDVSDNHTVGMYSGGILVTLGNVHVTDQSQIDGNTNNGPGGGIAANFLGSVIVSGGSEVDDNTGAAMGGGIVNFATPAHKVEIEGGSEVSNNNLTNAQSIGETLFIFLDYLASRLNISYHTLTGMTIQQSEALAGKVEAEIAIAHGVDPSQFPPGLVIAGGGIGTLQGARVEITGGSRVDGNYSGVRLANSAPNVTPNSSSVGIGGGVATFLSRIIVDQSTVAGNTSSEDGGGLWNVRGVSITSGSFVTGNTARGLTLGSLGGGLFLGPTSAGSLISDSTFSKNAAAGLLAQNPPPAGGFGGGAYNQGNLTILGSTFSENTATQDGGGLMNDSPTIPGQTNPILTARLRLLVGSTVTRNSAGVKGGGIFNGGVLQQKGSAVADNTPDNIATKM